MVNRSPMVLRSCRISTDDRDGGAMDGGKKGLTSDAW